MNAKQAIELLNELLETESYLYEFSGASNEPMNIALELTIETLGKQIPKNPTKSKWIGINGDFYDLCPCCEINLCTEGLLPSKKNNYCGNCGQKLDWNRRAEPKKADFDCEHCKHLEPSNKTNRLFCSYHSEGEHQYEVFRDEYCSYFERAESSREG